MKLNDKIKKQIKYVKIISGTLILESQLFDSFDSLECIVLPNTIREIKEVVFVNCPQLHQLHIPDNGHISYHMQQVRHLPALRPQYEH